MSTLWLQKNLSQQAKKIRSANRFKVYSHGHKTICQRVSNWFNKMHKVLQENEQSKFANNALWR
jgi:hypothetical protein